MANRTTKINWEDTIRNFNSYEGTVTDFCRENNLCKSQFYSYRKKLSLSNTTAFHAITLKEENTAGAITNTVVSKDIKIEIGKATILVPIGEVAILSDILKELIKTC